MALMLLIAPVAMGQPQVRRVNKNRRSSTPSDTIVVMEPTAPVQNLFDRAEEGVARSDWKFAIDSLQRIIDHPDGSLLARDPSDGNPATLFESARRRALRRLSTFPPDGIRAYRLIYDGMAKRLFTAGRSRHDPKPLRKVINRFLLTDYGDDAAELLSSWALDAGRPGEAITLILDVLALVPDPDVPRERLLSKLIAAYALLGRAETAQRFLTDYRESVNADQKEFFPLGEKLLALNPSLLKPQAEGLTTWQVAGGTPARMGLMPAAEPTLSGPTPWEVQLPGAREDAWRRVFRNGPDSPLVIPTGRLVSDGKRLFARVPRGCVALDPNDLSIRWFTGLGSSPPPVRRPVSRFARPVPRRTWEPPKTDDRLWFKDYTAGDITLGNDLVMVVTREGKSDYVYAHRDFRTGGLVSWAFTPILGTRVVKGARLVALDRHTGEIRWQRGRTGQPADPLGAVLFRSAPILVDGRLWVVYSRDKELFVGVLDPLDGALVTQVILGSVNRVTRSMPPPVRLAARDGLVFIPSGQGALFAVDAADATVRWVNRYKVEDGNVPAGDHEEMAGFLPSPPIAVGGKVLLAPEGTDELLAFDAITGDPLWRSLSGGSSYLIAADPERVWLGGRIVRCVSLSDGESLWSRPIASVPTGRAVLSGARILVPTLKGLYVFAADSGTERDAESLPSSQPPLGNLLCLNHTVYSLQSGLVRKFIDVERSYPSALTAYEADPTAPVAALNLAWLELLRKKPQRTFDILKALPPQALEAADRTAELIAHTRVEALLSLAGHAGLTGLAPNQVLDLLESAESAARDMHDRLRCSLAVADQLSAMGRRVDAYRRLWDQAVSTEADVLVPAGDRVSARARVLMAQRLQTIASEVNPSQAARMRKFVASRLEAMTAALKDDKTAVEGKTRLRAALDVGLDRELAQRALLHLAMDEVKQRHYALAEQAYRECATPHQQQVYRPSGVGAGSDTGVLSLAARLLSARLAASATRDDYASPASVNDLLTDVTSRFGSTPLDELRIAAADVGLDPDPALRTVNDWADHLRRAFALPVPFRSHLRPSDRPVQVDNDVLWSFEADRQFDLPRLVGFEGLTPGLMNDRFVVLSPGETLTCYRGVDRDVLWRSDLRLPGTFKDGITARWPDLENAPRRAAVDGQIAVFSSQTGIFAVELGTGRRLWARAYEWGSAHGGARGREDNLSADHGHVVTMLRSGRISLLRITDGATLWERDMLGERIGTIQLWKDRVITIDPRRERVHLLDRRNGALIAGARFHQPDPRGVPIEPRRTGNLLCGPIHEDHVEGVAAVDLMTGERAWEVRMDKPVVSLFVPAEGYLGIGLLGGHIRILDTANGEEVLDRRVSGAQGVLRGTMIDGTLLVQYYQTRRTVHASHLVALDVATDTELWSRDDTLPVWRSDEPLRVAGGRLPVLISHPTRSRTRKSTVALAMLDIRTGTDDGSQGVLPNISRVTQYNGDVLWLTEGVLVIGTETGIRAFHLSPSPEKTQDDF